MLNNERDSILIKIVGKEKLDIDEEKRTFPEQVNSPLFAPVRFSVGRFVFAVFFF